MNNNNEHNMNAEGLIAFIMSLVSSNVMTVMGSIDGLWSLITNDDDDATVKVAVKQDGKFSKNGKGTHVFGSLPVGQIKLALSQLMAPGLAAAAAPVGIVYKARATISAMVNGVIHVSTYAYYGALKPASKATCKAGVTLNKVRVTAHSQPAYYLLNGILLSGGFRLLTDGVDWKKFEQNCWTALRSLGALTGKEEPKNVIYQSDRLATLHAGYAKVDAPAITVDAAKAAAESNNLVVAEAGQRTTTVSRAQPVYDLDI
jgi:hypothetical protein